MSTMTPTQLSAWIEELRGRLDRGDLDSHPPLQVLPWLAVDDVEAYARRLIRDVDYWQEQPLDSRLGSAPIGVQQRIATELSALYERLVEGKPCQVAPWSPMGPPRDW